jgi:dTDP-4-dehydrorhamnose 3,5-epimerase
MEIRPTALTDVKILVPQRFGDARGFFSETWNALRMRDSGLDIAFVQDNESLSAQVGTLRGLHCQAPPFAQAKLVRVVQGAILDVAVDMRRGSPDFGRWIAEVISADNGAQILVPRGFLHGFVTLAPDTLVQYKVDNGYDAASDTGVRWDDPQIGIDWRLNGATPVLSDKDRALPHLADWTSPFTYGEPL